MTETRNSVLRIQRGKFRGAKSSPSFKSILLTEEAKQNTGFALFYLLAKKKYNNHFCDIKY